MAETREPHLGALVRLSPQAGHQRAFCPGEHGARWLGLELLRLPAGESWQGSLAEEEAALVILGGRCTVAVRARETARWAGAGSRGDIFGGLPTAVYAPRQSGFEVAAESALEIAIVKAPCEVDLPPRLIRPADVNERSTGMANWRRDVRFVIPPASAISQRLIVGETVNPPGNWSGIPPHKHDRPDSAENALEEFYWFKTRPAGGFGVQLLYHDAQAQAHIVGNDDVLLMLRGYHPTVAAPGTTVCYLWALSGESKAYRVAVDPRFDWVASAEAVMREEERRPEEP